jgi:hypothetical protein
MKIDRIIAWAAFIIANAALIFVVMFTISARYETGYNTRTLEEQSEKLGQARAEIELWRVYIETMRSAMIAKGIDVPPLPSIPVVKPNKPKL